MEYRLSQIPAGFAGTVATVQEIARLVKKDLARPMLRLIATRAIRSAGVPSKDQVGEAQALYKFVARRVRYQKDPLGLETVQSPEFTVRLGAGDCDDHSGLVAALAASVGLPVRFRVVGYDPDHLVHIFPEVYAGGRWLPADTTEPARGFGWRPARFPFEKTFNLKQEGVGMASSVLPIQRGDLKAKIRGAVWQTLESNWRNGLIDMNDLQSYLQVIRQKNFPSREPLLVDTTEETIRAFIGYAPAHLGPSRKGTGSLSGLEGLDGFLGSVWKAVKGAVGGVVKTVGKVAGAVLGTGSGGQVVVQPQVNVPAGMIQTNVPPESAASAVSQMLKSPVVWVGLGLLAFLVLKPALSGRR